MRRKLRFNRLIETTAWIAGSALLTAYGVAQWHFHRARDAGLSEFAAALDVDAHTSVGASDVAIADAHGDISRAAVVSSAVRPTSPVIAEDSRGTPDESDLRGVSAPDMTAWSPGRIDAYRRASEGSAPQGVLRIGSIDLEVPVFVGVSESNLNRGAAWIDGTAPLGQRGNAGLAAHRDGYFRALRHINKGDRIEVQTLRSTTSYVVDEILIVEPKDVQVLAPSDENRLTLVTCYPFYMIGPAPKRFIVRALAADTRVSAPAPS